MGTSFIMIRFRIWLLLGIAACIHNTACSRASGNNTRVTSIQPVTPVTPVPAGSGMVFYLTTSGQTALLAKQNTVLNFGIIANQFPDITVDTTQTYQSVEGYGYTLTGGSAELINAMTASSRNILLKELFGNDTGSIGVSYLRISIGASDLNSSVFTYDDISTGTTDVNLQSFTLDKDRLNFLPVLKQILAINPAIKIVACPWTAPAWMKINADNANNFKGGKLNPVYYSVYADYFVKYLQGMKAEGITIDAITPQNEPLNPGNNPSMVMIAAEQSDFIKNFLGPAFKAAGITTKIIIYDHNADRPDYPLAVLSDAGARQYVDGTAFHLYAGNISALTPVHDAYPSKNIYFTEQYTPSTGAFSGDLNWHVKNLIIGALRNWSRNVLEWNLASDPDFAPHTNGGCTTCKGAITINGNNFNRNVSYYIIGHASKFVKPGAVRVASNIISNLQNVAFVTPKGKKVLIVLNDNNTLRSFNIKYKDKRVTISLEAGSVGTYVW